MEQKAGAQISRKAFVQSFLILLALMLAAGVLTLVVPPGSYTRAPLADGREAIDPNSYQAIARPDYPIWRWLTAPVEVLATGDGLTIVTIILFLLIVGVAFALLDRSGVLKAAIARIVQRFGKRKYVLLLVVSFFFMLLGAFLGMFEEVVLLIPVMLALSYLLGWDTLVGLGMSILATNMGFSAAITNPFTIALAQKIAGLPPFSGAWLRIPFFLIIYAIFAFFLVRYARRVERDPRSSPVYEEDRRSRLRYAGSAAVLEQDPRQQRAVLFLAGIMLVILAVFFLSPFVEFLSAYSLPLVGLLFLIAGLGAALLSGLRGATLGRSALEGASGIAPGVPLILMAASVKHIVASGGIMDTILHAASTSFAAEGSYLSALFVFVLALALEFFVASASAKVFLLMPILFPLGDLVGLTRQTIVTAYCFGDGFTNMIYPTNAVLLISLGLASIPYGKWLRWTAKLWLWVLPVVLIFLGIAVAIRFGPF
jgi:uncharacterized ion transporter superfamily protein YfcC